MQFNFPDKLCIQPSAKPTLVPNPQGLRDEIDYQHRSIEQFGIAGRIWEAAYALDSYLDPPITLEFDPPCSITLPLNGVRRVILELGSGTGYTGLRIAEILTKASNLPVPTLVLTDLPDVLPLLESTSQRRSPCYNGSAVDLRIRPLSWGNFEDARRLTTELNLSSPTQSPTEMVLVCSDLVYFPELLAPLLRTLLHLTSFVSPQIPTKIIISYKIRSLSKETPFWAAFGVWFSFQPVLYRQRPSAGNKQDLGGDDDYWKRFGIQEDDSFFIFIAKRKPETLTWPIPDATNMDEWHRGERNGGFDDTFETLLLSSLGD